jgi:hypothetical protein
MRRTRQPCIARIGVAGGLCEIRRNALGKAAKPISDHARNALLGQRFGRSRVAGSAEIRCDFARTNPIGSNGKYEITRAMIDATGVEPLRLPPPPRSWVHPLVRSRLDVRFACPRSASRLGWRF